MDRRVPGFAGELGNHACCNASARLVGLILMIRKQKGLEHGAT